MLTVAGRKDHSIYLYDEHLSLVIKVRYRGLNNFGQPILDIFAPDDIEIMREKLLSEDELIDLEAKL